jgi:ribosomal protein L23
MHPLIKKEVLTEKSQILYALYGQYTYDVDVRLSKPQIRKLFKILFDVDITTLRTHRLTSRRRGRLSRGHKSLYKRILFRIKQSVLKKPYRLRGEESGDESTSTPKAKAPSRAQRMPRP